MYMLGARSKQHNTRKIIIFGKNRYISKNMDHPQVIRFYLKGPYFEFSNFYLSPVKINGFVYPSSEHAFQALKFLGPDQTNRSQEYAAIISSASTPGKARILANQKRVGGYKWKTDLNPTIEAYADVKIRTDWLESRDDVMRSIVQAKFQQHPKLKAMLIKTGSLPIEEDSPRDDYWGVGKNRDGLNMLGIILTEVRTLLKQ